MKAKELLYGIYVYFNCFDGSKIIAKVTGFNDGIVYGVSEHGTHWCQISKIEPIPLIPEILEKNGFVENRGVTSWKFETDREDLIDIYGVKDYHLSINIEDTHGSGKSYRWMLNNLTIFYVHQLQHALRLCGIEKEIIL